MAKKNELGAFGTVIAELFALYLIALPISAGITMVFWGAFSDNFGLPAPGYWTFYQILAFLVSLSGALFYTISFQLLKIKERL